MNTLNMTSMMGTWGTGAGMAFHGLAWLILFLAVGTVIWLLARAARHVLEPF